MPYRRAAAALETQSPHIGFDVDIRLVPLQCRMRRGSGRRPRQAGNLDRTQTASRQTLLGLPTVRSNETP
jgi:hypothetical protein